jgi:hypothetical protein
MMKQVDPDCMSAYLGLRYVPWRDKAWLPGVAPQLPERAPGALTQVASAGDIRRALTEQLASCDAETTGLLLSGGIDSAILAALLPAGTRAYTIRFVANDAIDETAQAAQYARSKGLVHRIVEVTWQDYLLHTHKLMRYKRAPLHAIEVALHKAALAALADGVETLIVGNGADSSFGGMDKLLSRDWSFEAFVERYTFVEPSRVLKEPRSLREVFAPYRVGELADVVRFLQEVHGPGIVQAFENAITAAGCRMVAPYEKLALSAPLDIARIRAGEPKYLLAELFRSYYDNREAPPKIAFARPMDQWLGTWVGPKRSEFLGGSALADLSGDQRWLVYCLEQFLDLLDTDTSQWP